MNSIGDKKTNKAQMGNSTHDSFLVSYLTVVIIVLGIFIYLTSTEELKSKESKGAWQRIQVAFNPNKMETINSNAFAPITDPTLTQLVIKQSKNKIQFELNSNDIFENEDDQIKADAILLLNKISSIAANHHARVASHLGYFVQPEPSPQHLKETSLALNRTSSLQRFFVESLKSLELVEAKILPRARKEDGNYSRGCLEITLEI